MASRRPPSRRPRAGKAAAQSAPVSALFISYRRVDHLRRNFQAFRDRVRYRPIEYVVADDGSPAADQAAIRQLPFDRFALAPRNRGLGANNNQGLRACTSEFILMLQDDWEAGELADQAIGDAVQILQSDPTIGIVRFYMGREVGPFEHRSAAGLDYFVFDHTKHDLGPMKHIYSDTPHLRRGSLTGAGALGWYLEGPDMEATEEDYAVRFDGQNRFHVAFLRPDETPYFAHTGATDSFRTTMLRHRIDAALRKAALTIGLSPQSPVWRSLRDGWFKLRDALSRRGLLK